MFSRRDSVITFINSMSNLAISGCANVGSLSSKQSEKGISKLSDSPNFNNFTKRFQHPNGEINNKSFRDLYDFFKEYFTRADDDWENAGFPVVKPSNAELQNFAENVMWLGHSSVLINHSNLTVLTDPQFSEYASPFSFMGPRRVTPAPFTPAELPTLDVVIISHNHYDHLDEYSIRQICKHQPDVKFLVPLGLKKLLVVWGAIDVTELDWWQPVEINDVAFHPTPVQHWSKRSAFDRNKTLWAGWFVKWQDFSFYFAGDTGYSNDFIEVTKRLGRPKLAAIPVGAYEPREFMKSSHINPEEAIKVFRDLAATFAIAIHWGTFKLTLEKMDEPPTRLDQAMRIAGVSKTRFRVLQHGQSWPEVFTG